MKYYNNKVSIDDIKQVKDVLLFIKLVCFYYSDTPNDTLKKKYYDFFINIPIYYTNPFFTEEYLALLNSNPLSSFLDNRNDLLHWCHFIETQILRKYGQQTQDYANWLLEHSTRYEKPHHYENGEKQHFLYNEYVLYGLVFLSLISIIKFNM